MSMLGDFVSHVRSWNRARLKKRRNRNATAAVDRDQRQQLALVALVKNEEMNIDEWVEHYLNQGASHLFFIDNGSTDNTIAKLEHWAATAPVTIVSRPQQHRQVEHYRWLVQNHSIVERFKWLLIADGDEFWFCKSGQGLADALDGFDGYDVLYANWSNFGCLEGQPHPASLRRELLMRQPGLGPHDFTKWIARTSALAGGERINVHKIVGACSSRTISVNDQFQLNHYLTQSSDFWLNVKMARGDVFDPANDRARNLEMFAKINADATFEDRALSDLVKARATERSASRIGVLKAKAAP